MRQALDRGEEVRGVMLS